MSSLLLLSPSVALSVRVLCAYTYFHIYRTRGWRPLQPPPARCASTHLVAVHHEVVCGDERFENYDPAAAAAALQQRVGQVGDADVQLIGAVDQIWSGREKHKVTWSVQNNHLATR